jgi:mxaA protein
MKHKPRLPLSAIAPLVLAALLAVALLLAALLPIDEARAASAPQDLVATPDEPRAFGYFVGDIVTRRIGVQVPAPLQLDPDSLPHAGRQGQALELRSVDWQGRGDTRTLVLRYQVFLAPREVRTLEMPPLQLRFTGGTRPQELRVDAWPVTVAPLVPVEVSPRTGLGDLRPDAPPPHIDTRPMQWRLATLAVIAALLLAYLAHVYLMLPWLGGRDRPFTQAWQQLRRLPAAPAPHDMRTAMQTLHQALNRSAGQVLFAQGVPAFVSRRPQFAPLADELAVFFEHSRRSFFGGDDSGAPERDWLLSLCRRCRDLERGAA